MAGLEDFTFPEGKTGKLNVILTRLNLGEVFSKPKKGKYKVYRNENHSGILITAEILEPGMIRPPKGAKIKGDNEFIYQGYHYKIEVRTE